MANNHEERKHAKYSASSMERLEACPGSAQLSEGQPDKSSPWALEGTEAHEVLEAILLRDRDLKRIPDRIKSRPHEMFAYAENVAKLVLDIALTDRGLLMVEEKVDLSFIHPDAGGSLDISVVALFGTLHIFDYKYGIQAVSPIENLQMITYAIGVAHKHHWNFKRIRMWIVQPRTRGYDGPVFWEIPTKELKEKWLPRIQGIVGRAITEPTTYNEGPHCHWCKAKRICPLKEEAKFEKTKSIFSPVGGTNDGEENDKQQLKSEAEWREEATTRKKGSRKTKGEARETETKIRTGTSISRADLRAADHGFDDGW